MTTEIEFRALEDVEWRLGDDEDGTFAGWACRYGKKDSYGTTFHPGVFKKGIDKRSYALLFMHDPTKPVGTFRAEERSDHLWIEGRYDDTAAGRDARIMARSGSAPELSVGFVRTDIDWKSLAKLDEEAYREAVENIRSARLVEVSQITARMAAVPGSKLKTVRSVLGELYAAADAPSLDERVHEERARLAEEAKLRERQRRAALLKLTTIGGV